MQRVLFFMLLFAVFIMGFVGLKDMKPLSEAIEQTIRVTVIYNNESHTLIVEPFATVDEVLSEVPLGDDVDESKINRQKIVGHRDVINIPILSQVSAVSINTATTQELQTLTGVGPKMAEDIITHRETQGSFQSLEDLMLVKGMGAKKFAKIKDNICL